MPQVTTDPAPNAHGGRQRRQHHHPSPTSPATPIPQTAGGVHRRSSNAPRRRDKAPEDAVDHEKHRRVWKACERCRMKKTKCDGAHPCRRCAEDGVICTTPGRRTNDTRQLPRGYAEVLETSQRALVETIHQLYAMVRDGKRWEHREPAVNAQGRPVIHDIANILGCIGQQEGPFPEDDAQMEQLALSFQQDLAAGASPDSDSALPASPALPSDGRPPSYWYPSPGFAEPPDNEFGADYACGFPGQASAASGSLWDLFPLFPLGSDLPSPATASASPLPDPAPAPASAPGANPDPDPAGVPPPSTAPASPPPAAASAATADAAVATAAAVAPPAAFTPLGAPSAPAYAYPWNPPCSQSANPFALGILPGMANMHFANAFSVPDQVYTV